MDQTILWELDNVECGRHAYYLLGLDGYKRGIRHDFLRTTPPTSKNLELSKERSPERENDQGHTHEALHREGRSSLSAHHRWCIMRSKQRELR